MNRCLIQRFLTGLVWAFNRFSSSRYALGKLQEFNRGASRQDAVKFLKLEAGFASFQTLSDNRNPLPHSDKCYMRYSYMTCRYLPERCIQQEVSATSPLQLVNFHERLRNIESSNSAR